MPKIDLKTTRRDYWTAPVGDFVVRDVPRYTFAMVDGEGNPNTAAAYQAAVSGLYRVSYKLKFMSKARGRDYVVPPLQGLWWADDMSDFLTRRKDRWRWTMMLMQPDWIDAAAFEEALNALRAQAEMPVSLRLAPFDEGCAVQTLHIGPYDDEGPTIKRLHEEYLPANGLTENGKHHEIYLSDPRRTDATRLKTILRQPVRVLLPEDKTR